MLTTKSLLPLGPDPCLVVILVLCLPGASFGCVFASDWFVLMMRRSPSQDPVLTSFLCPLVPGCRMSPKQEESKSGRVQIRKSSKLNLLIEGVDNVFKTSPTKEESKAESFEGRRRRWL